MNHLIYLKTRDWTEQPIGCLKVGPSEFQQNFPHFILRHLFLTKFSVLHLFLLLLLHYHHQHHHEQQQQQQQQQPFSMPKLNTAGGTLDYACHKSFSTDVGPKPKEEICL
jgi:hypothetical protein